MKTGKFARISGSGVVSFKCYSGAYADTWSGTITF